MIRKPLKLLVCLAVIAIVPCGVVAWGTGTGGTGIQGETLSVEPGGQPLQMPLYRSKPTGSSTSRQSSSSTTKPSSSFPAATLPVQVNPTPVRSVATGMPPNPRPAVCPPSGCPVPAPATAPGAASVWGIFSPSGILLSGGGCTPYLPRPGCRHFHLAARLWNMTINSNMVLWGANPLGNPGTELDLMRDLGLSRRQYVGEYEGQCYLRPNWSIRYRFMSIKFRENYVPPRTFWFGNVPYVAGLGILSTWDRHIHRADLMYDWFQADHAISSLFGGYAFYDDKLAVSNVVFTRARSRTFGLAYAGISIQRVLRQTNSSTCSLNCEWSTQFLEDYFGWDGYVGARVSVPMDGGRYGYLEAGWRWIVLKREYPADKDKTNLDGLMGTVGIVF